ncbi:hypothetical protein BaRGS_00003979 [Batillaria attramentaria]|uniref:Uncharacterized protein n=1 Tax=Batillaria attramentaria TaxID=370345 RepID=A0ABD0M0A2_9CAEN
MVTEKRKTDKGLRVCRNEMLVGVSVYGIDEIAQTLSQTHPVAAEISHYCVKPDATRSQSVSASDRNTNRW